MADLTLGKLTREQPRDVWANEAQDFTPWLAKNINLLNEVLSLEIAIDQREAPAGSFAVDLFGKEVGTGKPVIIENQLARTDHTHLGQLLTYAAGLNAGIIIWISPDFRDEHRETIHWLNSQTGDAVAFFAVELELLRIDRSLPAPRFNVVAEPSGFQRAIAQGATKPSARGLAYQKFFRDLVERLHSEHPGLVYTQPDLIRYDSWTTFGAGRSGFELWAAFTAEDRFRIALTITTGDKARNKGAFDQLYPEREAIGRELGEPPEWERLDTAVTSRVAVHRDGSIQSSDDHLDELKRWAVAFLPAFRGALEPRIKALNLTDGPASVGAAGPSPA